jgi:hypothetical protein
MRGYLLDTNHLSLALQLLLDERSEFALVVELLKRRRKRDRPHLPERPYGCFAQMGPVPFFVATRDDAVAESQ